MRRLFRRLPVTVIALGVFILSFITLLLGNLRLIPENGVLIALMVPVYFVMLLALFVLKGLRGLQIQSSPEIEWIVLVLCQIILVLPFLWIDLILAERRLDAESEKLASTARQSG